MAASLPMQGLCVVERADGVAAAFAGRLFALLGAETVMAEPPEGSALRRTAPFLPGGKVSALFAYHAVGQAQRGLRWRGRAGRAARGRDDPARRYARG